VLLLLLRGTHSLLPVSLSLVNTAVGKKTTTTTTKKNTHKKKHQHPDEGQWADTRWCFLMV